MQKNQELFVEYLTDCREELGCINSILDNPEPYIENCNTFRIKADGSLQEMLRHVEKIAGTLLNRVTMFLDEKQEPLTDWEKELYDLCNQCIKNQTAGSSKRLEGKYSLLVLGIGKLINLVSYLYEKYHLPTGEADILESIEAHGLSHLPGYHKTILSDVIELAESYVTEDAEYARYVFENLQEVQNSAEAFRKHHPNFTSRDAKLLLAISKYVYSGVDIPPEVQPLLSTELPEPLCRSRLYNAATGIYDIPGGMKVFFGKEGSIKNIVAFAGTDITGKIPTLGADIQQLISPNLMYLRAVGIVHMMMREDKHLIVTGHSLGGGLAQTAVLANTSMGSPISCAAFNSAGLSKETFEIARSGKTIDLMHYISSCVTHYRAEWDLVSAVGALIGTVVTLEGATPPYHCISNIENCNFG